MKRGKPLERKTPLRSVSPITAKQQKKPARPKRDPGEDSCKIAVKKRSEGICEICGLRTGQSVHHRRKQSQDGPWTPSNCLHLCGDGRGPDGCHGMVTNTRSQYYDYGFLVHGWEGWATKPVLYRGELVVLDDAGGLTPALDFGQEAA